MAYVDIANVESGASVRSKINAVGTQSDANNTALTTREFADAKFGDVAGGDYSEFDTDGTLNTGTKRIKSMETSTGTASVGDVEIHICNSSSDYVLTLPAHEAGREIRIINRNTGVVTITPTSGTVKGETTALLYEWESLILLSEGSHWV